MADLMQGGQQEANQVLQHTRRYVATGIAAAAAICAAHTLTPCNRDTQLTVTRVEQPTQQAPCSAAHQHSQDPQTRPQWHRKQGCRLGLFCNLTLSLVFSDFNCISPLHTQLRHRRC